MSNHKNKCLLLLLGVLVLGGCTDSKKSSIISSELVSEESGFGIDEAKNGDFVDEVTLEAERMYPMSDHIAVEYDGVKLKEINVKTGQTVKKGDLLVTVEPVTEAIMAEKEAAITNNQEESRRVLESYQTTIDNLRNDIAASTGTQQKLYQTQLEKAQKQYEWYEQEASRAQKELEAERDRFRSLPADLNIYAPYDGVVDKISKIESGMELSSDKEIMTIHSEEQVLLNIKKGSQLRYGQQVKVETGSGENLKTYKGTIISADNIRGDDFKNGSAIVHIEDKIPSEELGNVRVKANTKELHNVLLVRNYAVNTEKEKDYISISEGDKIMKRRIITGGSCGGYTWVLQGIKEGQSVSIQ
ncbi:MAG: biotin/lipoyl-binding protein [Lachnospiraceae bacterium]|nr:biotin/lipoyl-binding protein [Lachnospiraceae bacterium]